jgi:hypothetical protein
MEGKQAPLQPVKERRKQKKMVNNQCCVGPKNVQLFKCEMEIT